VWNATVDPVGVVKTPLPLREADGELMGVTFKDDNPCLTLFTISSSSTGVWAIVVGRK
jgi:hypothetical protein